MEGQLGVNHRVDGDFEPADPIPPPENRQRKTADISDREWEIRTGRAIFILRQTLPNFFDLGLVSSPSHDSLSPSNSKKASSSLTPVGEPESIYSPKIRLVYTPPVKLPSPFPTTLQVEGMPLYMASSVFIRHTLNTLYSDLHVELLRISLQNTPTPNHESGSSVVEERKERGELKRDKCLFVGLCVRGTSRVSGAIGEWQVNSTYTFSPTTGAINKHIVNSIYPAPHLSVYDALRSSFGRVFGLAAPVPGEVTRLERVRVGEGSKGNPDGV
ncbi:hypothetical protein FIBSPDRAFT_760330 [Athelia psychrophila]|uniref:Uncharacterized protein n=1 Tax=Athelia psychrophila TaxID=1759441 RepID=A0A165Y3D7_9AGAM|nr:hypothetical protein FIBSPDRAFT_760330 [Fibularhizoctonia sp. CBS 109695]